MDDTTELRLLLRIVELEALIRRLISAASLPECMAARSYSSEEVWHVRVPARALAAAQRVCNRTTQGADT